MRRTWRFWLSLWAGKFAAAILRWAGKKGTTFPGFIASRITPNFISILSQNYIEGIIIVTGTNGKTTTANLLANILKSEGKKFAFNQAGANMVTGITGAMLENTTWSGESRAKLALFEVDEATIPKVCEMVTPRLAVVTNFFRDQLDRYGELDTTVRLVKEALPEVTELILNADDPLVAQFGIGKEREGDCTYYGVDLTPESESESKETREARFCPQCGRALDYSLFHYGQLGIYVCPGCDFRRPRPQALAERVRMEEGNLVFQVGITTFRTSLQGYYNLYNALAALSAAKRLGISDKTIEQGLREFTPQAGRMERFSLAEGEVTLTLVKNPTGFNQVIRTFISEIGNKRLLIGINDLAADGRDISWLWDVDFERLGEDEENTDQIVCSGLRAEDMALRLKYAGVSAKKLVIEHDLEKALKIVQQDRTQEDSVFILPTYTLLFPMRDLLEKYSISISSIKVKPLEKSTETKRMREEGRG